MATLSQVVKAHFDECYIWTKVSDVEEWRIFLSYAIIMQMVIEREAFFQVVGEPCGVG